jgi:hypothetical protein
MQVLQSGQRPGWPLVQQVESGTQALPHTLVPGLSRQLPLLHSRQVPLQPGPATPFWVGWQRLFWQVAQTPPPQSLLLQQFPSTQLPPQFRSPPGQLPLQGWLRGMQAPLHSRKPELQVNEQLLPSQLGVALAGAGHRPQRSPQDSTLRLSRQVPLQSWKPPRQL